MFERDAHFRTKSINLPLFLSKYTAINITFKTKIPHTVMLTQHSIHVYQSNREAHFIRDCWMKVFFENVIYVVSSILHVLTYNTGPIVNSING